MDKTIYDFRPSQSSLIKGLDYYKDNHVLECKKGIPNLLIGKVQGSEDNIYDVCVDLDFPFNSTCTCPFCQKHPHAFCKHKVALVFKAYPKEYERFIKDLTTIEDPFEEAVKEYKKELSSETKKVEADVKKWINKMTPEEIKNKLFKYELYSRLQNFDSYLKHKYGLPEDFEVDDDSDQEIEEDLLY